MKQKDILEQSVADYLTGKDIFLVEIKISADNDIEVVIENENEDISLDDCVELSNYIESKLSRDVEDFALTVGSAGLTSPFKVARQYKKFVGSEIEVTAKNGSRQKVILEGVKEDGIDVSSDVLVKVDGQKKKVLEHRTEHISFKEIKTAKPVIKFK
ncbi:MAG: ribosome assembly cofactor RimP [Bacteroidales bacterium]|nr:ribosome assembly cofactor RimP [Bacteroidales bacterium]